MPPRPLGLEPANPHSRRGVSHSPEGGARPRWPMSSCATRSPKWCALPPRAGLGHPRLSEATLAKLESGDFDEKQLTVEVEDKTDEESSVPAEEEQAEAEAEAADGGAEAEQAEAEAVDESAAAEEDRAEAEAVAEGDQEADAEQVADAEAAEGVEEQEEAEAPEDE